ncbi:MAG: Gfo/Idh/MocA family oxidoreductase [Candidatus Tritonobacter lacicola]|nr:Gfo/Idh/MocA family oxidoreductase [Candidatus Tritonobacter lacicola]
MIRLAVIGAGHWGPNLIRNFDALEEATVATICDADEKALSKIKGLYPTVGLTTDSGDVMSDKGIDAVVIASSAVSHAPLVRAALEAGKDVFVEKPLALSVKDGEELVSLADKEKKILMVGHLLEYHPAVEWVKNHIESGSLGDLRYIYSTRVNLGKLRREENALWSFAPHDISVILFLVGREPLEVTARGQAYLREGVEDIVFITIQFPDKVMAHIHVSWLDPHKIRKFTIVGSKEMVVFDDVESSEKIRVYDKGVDYKGAYESYGELLTLRIGDIHIPKIPNKEPLKIECRTFIESISTRKPPRTDGRDGLRVLKVLDAAQKSLEARGVPVKV